MRSSVEPHSLVGSGCTSSPHGYEFGLLIYNNFRVSPVVIFENNNRFRKYTTSF
jgi:hypothetical protein